MKSELLFSAKLRELRYLLERDYLNKKGKNWANSILNEDDEKLPEEDEDKS